MLAAKAWGLSPAVVFCFVVPANAEIIGVSGRMEEVSPPVSVVQNTFEDDDNIRVFLERNPFILPNDIKVDISVPGRTTLLSDFTPSVLPAGTAVSTSYLIYDPVGTSHLRARRGTITLDSQILGIIFRTGTLTPTHLDLGHAGTLYQMTNEIGAYGADYNQDVVILSADRQTLTARFAADGGADSIRVIAAAFVPEPTSIVAWLSLGLMGIGMAYRRKRRLGR